VLLYTLVFVAAAAFFAAFQFQTRSLVGYDGYYHIKYSYILRTEGWRHNLPWLQCTIYRDYYRDHHLLFHLLLIPFTLGGTADSLRWGAKVAATLFPALMAVSFFALMRAARVPRAWLWMIALAGAGTAFLYRMTMPRPMAGALALLLLAGLLLVKRRYRALGALTAVGVWYYDGYGMIVLLALMFFVAHWLVEGRPNWRPLAWCLAGAAAGIVINPYFYRNIESYLFNFYRSFSGMETRMGGGSEWRVMGAWKFVASAPGAALALLVVALAGRWCRRPRADTVAFILITAVTFLMACKARRYMEYYPPLAVVAAALTVRDLRRTEETHDDADRSRTRRRVLVLSLAMAAMAALVVPRLSRDITRSQDYRTFAGAARHIAKHSKPGDLVFNGAYDDFPQLFFYNHKNHYVVGLDPIYLYRHDAELFDLWRAIGRGERLDVYDLLKNRFKARWVVMERGRFKRFVATTMKDRKAGKIKSRYADPYAFVFEVM